MEKMKNNTKEKWLKAPGQVLSWTPPKRSVLNGRRLTFINRLL